MKNRISHLLALMAILLLASSCSNIEVYDLIAKD